MHLNILLNNQWWCRIGKEEGLIWSAFGLSKEEWTRTHAILGGCAGWSEYLLVAYSGLCGILQISYPTYSGTSIIQSPRDQTVLFELLRLNNWGLKCRDFKMILNYWEFLIIEVWIIEVLLYLYSTCIKLFFSQIESNSGIFIQRMCSLTVSVTTIKTSLYENWMTRNMKSGLYTRCNHGEVSWYIQSTLVISTSLISNYRLSRSENLVPV